MDMEGKVALLTGGGGGIGRAGAEALAAAGCAVVVTDIDAESASSTADSIVSRGGQAEAFPCDVTKDDQVEAAVEGGLARFGAIDILWSHAGQGLMGRPERIPIEDWTRQLDLNVLGSVRMVRSCLPHMFERGRGHIVITSSRLGLFPRDVSGLGAPYVVAKSALIALARTLAPYAQSQGVGVSILVPGITATQHTFDVPTFELDRDTVTAMLDHTKLRDPEFVAEQLVAGLRSDAFLISCIEGLRVDLVADAESGLAPDPSGYQEPGMVTR